MQILVNGIISGLSIALMALAFNVIYLPTRIFYVALGGLFSITPYIYWESMRQGSPWYLGIFLSLLGTILLSAFYELINHGPLERRKASLGTHLVSSLGFYIITVQAIVLIWGNETKSFREGLDLVLHFGMITLTLSQLLTFVISIILLIFFHLWLKFTKYGLKFRALSDNPVEFVLRGYNVNKVRYLSFGISGLLCATSSLLASNDIGFEPYGGLMPFLYAVVATIIGGRKSLLGPVLGGIMLGILRTGAVWFLTERWQEALTFILLALFLFVRPYGLIGRKARLESEL